MDLTETEDIKRWQENTEHYKQKARLKQARLYPCKVGWSEKGS